MDEMEFAFLRMNLSYLLTRLLIALVLGLANQESRRAMATPLCQERARNWPTGVVGRWQSPMDWKTGKGKGKS